MNEYEEPAEETVMLTRRVRRAREADAAPEPAAAEDDDIDEHTIVIDRSGIDERTVVMTRAAAGSGTAVEDEAVAEGATVDESTVVLFRGPRSDAASTTTAFDEVDEATVPAPPRRRETAEVVPSIYKPRPAPLVPSRPPVVTGSIAPTRDTAAATASVVKRSRRMGIVAVLSVAGASVISVAGLVVLGFVVFG